MQHHTIKSSFMTVMMFSFSLSCFIKIQLYDKFGLDCMCPSHFYQ